MRCDRSSRTSRKEHTLSMMKKYLLPGFIILLPIALTIMIIIWLFDLFTTPFLGVAESIVLMLKKEGFDLEHHASLVMLTSRMLALIFLVIVSLLLGFLGRKIFFKAFLQSTHILFLRIPFIKTIYRISKEVTGAIFAQDTKTFKQTVMISFPHLETQTLGFITGEAPNICKQACPEVDKSVLVLTSPHPLSGYLILSPKKNIIEVDISVEDTFKFLLSCGTAHPQEKPPLNS